MHLAPLIIQHRVTVVGAMASNFRHWLTCDTCMPQMGMDYMHRLHVEMLPLILNFHQSTTLIDCSHRIFRITAVVEIILLHTCMHWLTISRVNTDVVYLTFGLRVNIISMPKFASLSFCVMQWSYWSFLYLPDCSPLTLEDSELMTGLLETIVVLWEGIRESIDKSGNKQLKKKLITTISGSLPLLFDTFKVIFLK